jgi:hypothetical protein
LLIFELFAGLLFDIIFLVILYFNLFLNCFNNIYCYRIYYCFIVLYLITTYWNANFLLDTERHAACGVLVVLLLALLERFRTDLDLGLDFGESQGLPYILRNVSLFLRLADFAVPNAILLNYSQKII